MQYKIATTADVEAVLKLHAKYQINTIQEEDKKDGFVTTAFSKEELLDLIVKERGLFIATKDTEVLAYVMSASWEFWSRWEMFAFMIQNLDKLTFEGEKLSVQNSYQYGPICIDKSVRGTAVLPEIFHFALSHMAKRYPYLITFVNRQNPRSFQAHHRKLGLKIIDEFHFNDNTYHEMACKTAR